MFNLLFSSIFKMFVNNNIRVGISSKSSILLYDLKLNSYLRLLYTIVPNGDTKKSTNDFQLHLYPTHIFLIFFFLKTKTIVWGNKAQAWIYYSILVVLIASRPKFHRQCAMLWFVGIIFNGVNTSEQYKSIYSWLYNETNC